MTTNPPEDYYALLGVTPDADHAQLRRIWRKLALRWHPDHAGPQSTAAFQKLSAAYEVLSDPLARAAYDRRHGLSKHRSAARNAEGTPATKRRRAPGVMVARLCGALNTLLACGIARFAEDDDDTIELFLNAKEAAQGGMVTISMRVPVRCSACTKGDTACHRCAGQGTTDELFSAWLAIPPEVTDGTVLAPSELLRGMVRPVHFRMRVRAGR